MVTHSSWKDEAWENLLKKIWDKRKAGSTSIEYSKNDLEPILAKYTKSGQGEIRIFHSGSNSREALKRRGLVKIPLSRTKWKLVRRSQGVNFSKPSDGDIFKPHNPLTEGMIAGIVETMGYSSNPGETTLLAIANHAGIIADFYGLEEKGILFTGGRQKAGIHLVIDSNDIDMSKAQIEIDGGFEWSSTAVIAEVKSSFNQPDFDVNQALLPMLKWKKTLPNKKVYSMVLLAETNSQGIEYWVYDLQSDSGSSVGMKITRSKRYLIDIKESLLVRP